MKLSVQLWTAAILLAVIPASGLAKREQVFKFEDGDQVGLEIPRGWQTAKNIFGIPLSIIGPEHRERTGGIRRPVLMVMPTGERTRGFSEKNLRDEQKDYQIGRKAWLAKHDGTAIQFFPYQKTRWPHVSQVHKIGYHYLVGQTQMVEQSYYVVCKQKLYHVKSMFTPDHLFKYKKELDHTLRSFKCI